MFKKLLEYLLLVLPFGGLYWRVRLRGNPDAIRTLHEELCQHGLISIEQPSASFVSGPFTRHTFDDSVVDSLLKDMDQQSQGIIRALVSGYQNPHYISDKVAVVFPRKPQSELIKCYQESFEKKYGFAPEGSSQCASGLAFVPASARKQIKGSVFLDGGAYVGDTAFSFLEYDPQKVYAFEPDRRNHASLTENIERNGLSDRIIAQMKGLGSAVESRSFCANQRGASRVASSTEIAAGKAAAQIECVPIDDFVRAEEIQRVGLIKLDVEGFEKEVVQGALETIKRDRPVLLISIYHNPKDMFEIRPLLDALQLGYHFEIRYCDTQLLVDYLLIGWPET